MPAPVDERAQARLRLRRGVGGGDAERVEALASAILNEERLGRGRVFDQKSRLA
jgi:hypothetical protein